MKKIFSIILSVTILITSVLSISLEAFANTLFDDGITASFDIESGTLYISGEQEAELENKYTYDRDWTVLNGINSLDDVKVIDISGNVVRIGAGVFSDFKSTERIIIRNFGCSFGDDKAVPPNAEICGQDGSAVQSFAEENGFAFRKLFWVQLNFKLTERETKRKLYPEGTKGSEIVDSEKIFVNFDDTHHTEYYFPTSQWIDKNKGLEKSLSLDEWSRVRTCVFEAASTVAPTCSEKGYTVNECTICHNQIKSDYTDTTPHTYKEEIKKAILKENGAITQICTSCGAKGNVTSIPYPKSITLSSTSYVYNGKAKKPSVKVIDSNGKEIASSNYTVTYASGRKLAGKYSVTVAFKGNYTGSKTLYFTINPKPTTISKLTASSKGFTVSWKKASSQVTGYQIQYATNSNFTSGKKLVTVSGAKKTSSKISKLKGNKKYYVRVRTYKSVNGKKYYSTWSKAKTVKTNR